MKLLFIVLVFMGALGIHIDSANNYVAPEFDSRIIILKTIENKVENQISITKYQEDSISQTSSQNNKFLSSTLKNNFNFNVMDEENEEHKILEKFSTNSYNKLFSNKFYKLSLHLKNEICTRAP